MNEATRQEFTVDGFTFGSRDDVELANQELAAAKFIEKKVTGKSLETLKSVYEGCIERRMFRTPVGYAYLKELQHRMRTMGMPKDNIAGIPLYQIYNDKLENEPKPPRAIVIPKKKDNLRRINAWLILAVTLLIVLVIALFVITLTGENPNVLNYRYTIENEYANWQQELKDREAVIRAKERELGIKASGDIEEYGDE